MEKGKTCYHLSAVKAAIEQDKIEVIKFQDSEFESFILALVQDLV
jgi:predicted nucleic acid-binding Zn finger protein